MGNITSTLYLSLSLSLTDVHTYKHSAVVQKNYRSTIAICRLTLIFKCCKLVSHLLLRYQYFFLNSQEKSSSPDMYADHTWCLDSMTKINQANWISILGEQVIYINNERGFV